MKRILHHNTNQRLFTFAVSCRWKSDRAVASEEWFSSSKVPDSDLEDGDVDEVSTWSEGLQRRTAGIEGELERLWWIMSDKEQLLRTSSSWSIAPAGYSQDAAPPRGTSSLVCGPMMSLLQRQRSVAPTTEHALTEQAADVKVRLLARTKRLHQLNYYSTMNLTPKRNMWHATYYTAWNGVVALHHAVMVVPLFMLRAVLHRTSPKPLLVRLPIAALQGLRVSLTFLTYGFIVSPAIHIPNGIVNSLYGVVNAYRGSMFYDATSGRYFYCDTRHADVASMAYCDELRRIKTVGTLEFRRKKMEPDGKFVEQVKKVGFRLRKRALKGKGEPDANEAKEDPYEVLQVKRTSTAAQIKTQYKKLAKVFHPDSVQSQNGGVLSAQEKQDAQAKFEEIAEAYQILSNPERKRAYDQAGRQGLKLHESKFGHFASSSAGEMVQSVFGGRAFREILIGELYKSHWDLRYQHQIAVSLHDMECMQCIRVMLLAVKLRNILDVHAKDSATTSAQKQTNAAARPQPTIKAQSSMDTVPTKTRFGAKKPTKEDPLLAAKQTAASSEPRSSAAAQSPECAENSFSSEFKQRCDVFVNSLAGACYGPELLNDLGMSYIVSGRRFLGLEPFYAPKMVIYKSFSGGFRSLMDGFSAQVGGKSEEQLAKMVMAEWFNMEYHNIWTDVTVVVRYTAQIALQDVQATESERRRRAYALWYLGLVMRRHGKPFGDGKKDDDEMIAYLQQAATSVKSTGPPPSF